MYWQTALYFALVDHLVQERSDRLLLQENRFLGQYLVPAKLNASNSEVHDNNIIIIIIIIIIKIVFIQSKDKNTYPKLQ